MQTYAFLSLVTILAIVPQLRAADGQCFIATKGGANVKLGLVEVRVLAKEDVAAYKAKNGPILNQRIVDFKREMDRISRIMEANRNDLPVYAKGIDRKTALTKQITDAKTSYYLGIKAPILASTKSDADGKFKIAVEGLPPFYVLAIGKRLLGQTVENYAWLIEDKNFTAPYFLSNDNADTWLSLPP